MYNSETKLDNLLGRKVSPGIPRADLLRLFFNWTHAEVREFALAHLEDIRLHPNGFIQLDCPEDFRLDVWPYPRLQAQTTDHPIHDHSFALVSSCLHGVLQNTIYDPYPRVDGDYEIYRVVREPGSQNTTLESTGEYVDLFESRVSIINRGDIYEVNTGVMHRSSWDSPTITLIKKGKSSHYRPRVAVPRTIEAPDNDFRRDDPALKARVRKVFEHMIRTCL